MTPAVLSLVALLVAIGLSLTSRINVGVVAIVFAWLIGIYAAGWDVNQVTAGFPSSLFLTLAGVTLLFAIAETNGTLERLANRAIGLARGNTRLIPLILFVVAFALSSVGPGAITTVALLIPLGMALSTRAGVPRFLTALMVANGANAGNLSPLSAVGIVADSKMTEAGIGGHEGKVWLASLAAHAIAAGAAYLLLGRTRTDPAAATETPSQPIVALDRRHWLTIAVMAAWIVTVIVLKVNVGMAAFAAAALLIIAAVGDESLAIRRVPWGVIVMVTGVTLLIAVLEKTGGMDLFAGLLARLASPATVNGVIAFVTGLISSWSSTSGVVLPAFLPTVPDLVTRVGGGDPLAVALSICVGSAMVDVSPLSTLGALCVATVADPAEARDLFRKLLLWGLSMSVVAALLCQLFAGPLARA